MTIGIFYFSGTGNTKKLIDWLAQGFADLDVTVKFIDIANYAKKSSPQGETASMEHSSTESALLEAAQCDQLIFAYPVQGSMAPMVVWQFVQNYKMLWQGKQGAVLATQYLFSGDGAAYRARVLRKCGMTIKATEHFRMPNNISDVKLIHKWIKNGPENEKIYRTTKQRAELFAVDFVKGRHLRVGDHIWGILLGAIQRVPYGKMEPKLAKDVKIHCDVCTHCGLCVSICPVGNLEIVDQCAQQKGHCTICYRCVNQCPERAISILSKYRPNKQFRG